MADYVHKQFPLNDEELRCRHSAETLVNSDEEESTHPVKGNKPTNLVIKFSWETQFYVLLQSIYLVPHMHSTVCTV